MGGTEELKGKEVLENQGLFTTEEPTLVFWLSEKSTEAPEARAPNLYQHSHQPPCQQPVSPCKPSPQMEHPSAMRMWTKTARGGYLFMSKQLCSHCLFTQLVQMWASIFSVSFSPFFSTMVSQELHVLFHASAWEFLPPCTFL